jgi:hypothetical protein
VLQLFVDIESTSRFGQNNTRTFCTHTHTQSIEVLNEDHGTEQIEAIEILGAGSTRGFQKDSHNCMYCTVPVQAQEQVPVHVSTIDMKYEYIHPKPP